MTHRLALGGLPLCLVLHAGCSTLAPLPSKQECRSDVDCTVDGEVCAPDTQICVRGAFAPRAVLGFDIQELQGTVTVFRAEVDGCDQEVKASADNELAIIRNELSQTFELRASVTDPIPAEPTVDDLLKGEFELTQATRFARQSPLRRQLTYPTLEGSGETLAVVPTTVRWPRYHPLDKVPATLEGGGFVLWRIRPESRAPVFQMLTTPQTLANRPCRVDEDCCGPNGDCSRNPNICWPAAGECTAIGNPRFDRDFTYEDRCDRTLTGDVAVVDPQVESLGPLVGGSVSLRHADNPTGDRLGVLARDGLPPGERAVVCTDDSDCLGGEQFCELQSGQCVLAMAGRRADSNSATTDELGRFSAAVYTYCQDDPSNTGVLRSFTATVAPPGPRPSVSYEFTAQFAPTMASDKPVARLPKQLCVPDWGPPTTVDLVLQGTPRVLIPDGDRPTRCCDVGCLPATADAPPVGSVPEPTSCTGTTVSGGVAVAEVATPFVLTPAEQALWEASACQVPRLSDSGVAGEFRPIAVKCSTDGGTRCRLEGLAPGSKEGVRAYRLKIESPVGAVVGSVTTRLELREGQSPSEIAVRLPPRLLVQGSVELAGELCEQLAPAGGDCGSEGAVVLAERLRMADDAPDQEVGPFFHEVKTFFDPVEGQNGRFILPLDPGVYVITALPGPGSAGGPGALRLLDVRDGRDVQGLQLRLQPGVLVTLNVESFDPRAQIVPLDRGSWASLLHPDRGDMDTPRFLDLNRPGECYGPPEEGCRIRRLIPGAILTPGQVGRARFVARQVAGASCPEARR